MRERKRMAAWLCVLVMAVSLFADTAWLFGRTTVKAADAIAITNAAELAAIGNDSAYPLDGDYMLTADIDLSGVSWTPIGGTMGNRGGVTGANVFSGTFDGQGHVISNLTMDQKVNVQDADCAQLGFFSSVAGSSTSDAAVVKNIIFTDVQMKADVTGGFTSYGVLAGEVNGCASVENIAVLSGESNINVSNASDLVGAGGIIGECRTDAANGGNGNITVRNCYNGAALYARSSTDYNYAGGIIGRIAKSNCKEVSACVNTGLIYFKEDLGWAVSGFDSMADSSCISNCYFLFDTARANGGTEYTQAELTTGTLPEGLAAENWYAQSGAYPYPLIVRGSSAEGYLALLGLQLEFASSESASAVMTTIKLPQQLGGIPLTWESSNDKVLSISVDTATASGVLSPVKVVLTATTDSGQKRSFTVTVVSNVKAAFEQNYAKPGEPLRVVIENKPADMQCSYAWSIDGKTVAGNTTDTYIPKESDLESFISVKVTADNYDEAGWEISMYCSELPVMYINTEGGKAVTDTVNYVNASCYLQGNDEFHSSKQLYDNAAYVRGRGNSTWSYSYSNDLKKPYKLKLDKKTDLLGMGKNKHWALLANMIDHTNMRNKLMYEFSNDIGMESYMQSENVVLIWNGSYEGVYQLCEQIRVGSERVDIFDWEGLGEDIASEIAKAEGLKGEAADALEEAMAADLSWYDTGVFTFRGTTYRVADYHKEVIPEFTGGFIMDMDFRLDDSKFISKFRTDYDQPMYFKRPEYAKTSTTMMEYTKNYLQSFENAIHSDNYYADYNGEDVHYSQLFDMDSLVQNFFVMEYSMNWDGMKNSTYMYKDLEGLAKMGPAWDFDWCWGNINMYSMTGPYVIEGWHTTEDSFCEQGYQYNNWNRSLITDPYFAVKVYEKWKEIRPTVIEDMIKTGGKIDTLTSKYETASLANDERWSPTYWKYSGYGITDGKVTYKQSETYHDAITSMRYFIENRVAWLDRQFDLTEGKEEAAIEKLLASWGAYHGSRKASVASVDTASEIGCTVVTAEIVSENAFKAAFYVNGRYAGSETLTDGTAVCRVPDSMLEASSGAWNVVQVRAVDAAGSFVKENENLLTDYQIFTKEISGKDDDKKDDDKKDDNKKDDDKKDDDKKNDDKKDDDKKNDDNKKDDTPVITPKVTLNLTAMTLQVKKSTKALKPTFVYPANDKVKSWRSTVPSVAVVDKNGKITAKKTGKTVIVVTTESGATAECKLTVQKKPVKTTKLTLTKTKITLKKGKKYTIRIKSRRPLTASDTLTYTSSKKSVATVTKKGVIKAVGKGRAKITVKASGKKRAVMTVQCR